MPADPIPPRDITALRAIASEASLASLSNVVDIAPLIAAAVCPPGYVVVPAATLQRVCELATDAADCPACVHGPGDDELIDRLWTLANAVPGE